jgi:hypothetical protein
VHVRRETAMRLFLGILLGIFITIAGAYVYDSMTVGTAVTSPGGNAEVVRPMVNWDVVDGNWRQFKERVRHTWNRLVERT